MIIIGYCTAFFIGISLGMIGSGGSILTVPILVYLMNVNPLLATTSSLFIVGTTSLAGGISAYFKKQVDIKAVMEFGMPSIFFVYLTRHYLLPTLPEQFFYIGDKLLSKEVFLMLAFAVLMLIVSISIIIHPHKEYAIHERSHRHKGLKLIVAGSIIGIITGLLGAGGGFVIIPFLVFFLKLPMKTAVGTSLLIIALNSLFGFLSTLNQFDYNWPLLSSFTVLSIAGVFTGGLLADKISGHSLKKGFGWFVLAVGGYIIIAEMFLK